MHHRLIYFIALLPVLTVGCGQVGINADMYSGLGSMGSSACENELRGTFASTMHPFLVRNCQSCHSSGHGSADLNTAFTGFMSKGESFILSQAVRPHGGNNLGPHIQAEIDPLLPTWNTGKERFNSCLAEATVGGGSSSVLKTNAKTPANLAGTVTNANQWITVTWDLETEVPAAQAAQWPALLSIQTRFAVNANQVVGFQFRNPMLRLKATGRNLAVSGLKIFVNDEEQNLITTFLGFRTVVAVTTDFPLVPGTSAGIGWRPDSVATDQVAIEIQNIEFTTDSATVHNPGGGNPGNGLPLPTSITYAQLTSTDPDLGIFRNECFMCHSGANPSASLNLSDAAQTRLQSNLDLIRLRAVTQGNMPMRGLSQRQKDILNLWLNTGAPL